MVSITILHYLVLSALLAAAGVAVMLTKRNAIGVLMGVELLLNAAAVNLVAFNRYHPWNPTGAAGTQGVVFAMFIVVLAAAEAAIALAIFLNFYHQMGTVDVDQADGMKG